MITCPNCSSPVADDRAAFCPHCGRPLAAAAAPPTVPQPAKISGKAIASLVCGIPFFGFFTAIAAIVLGHLAKRDIRRSGGRLKGDGLATAGLVLGYGGVAIVVLILIIAFIAIPYLLRARMLANEASAIGSLRAISIAATTYAATYNNGFPPSLAALGPPSAGGNAASCNHANLIGRSLAEGQVAGYFFSYTGRQPVATEQPGCSRPGFRSYTAHADPVTRGRTGHRSFFVDPSGVIRYDATRPATTDDPPIGG